MCISPSSNMQVAKESVDHLLLSFWEGDLNALGLAVRDQVREPVREQAPCVPALAAEQYHAQSGVVAREVLELRLGLARGRLALGLGLAMGLLYPPRPAQ